MPEPLNLDSTLPGLRSLLATLLGLSSQDAELPVNLLLRLNPAALCQPMVNMARVGVEHADNDSSGEKVNKTGINAWLHGLYPELGAGHVYELESDLSVLFRRGNIGYWFDMRNYYRNGTLVGHLIEQSYSLWVAYHPLSMLYMLGERVEGTDYLSRILEAELNAHPDVRRMILDFAGGPKKTSFDEDGI